jgi:acyl-CoA dehydrogenase
LHVDTLAGLEAETRGAFLLAFELVELLGRQEAGELDDTQRALLRVITPIAKLLTAKQAVAVVSECIEAFGGAGYVEDTGLPALLRDAQVLPIWEGTTNVLALDTVLRGELSAGLPALRARIEQAITIARGHERLAAASQQAQATIEHVFAWLSNNDDPRRLQANARRIAMTMGRALELSLLIEHAARVTDWAAAASVTEGDHWAAVRRFAAAPVDLLTDINSEDSARLIE